MLEFFISVVIAVAVALGWLAVWAAALRLLGIRVLTRTPEVRAASRERIMRMGKARYILLFGMLGHGLAMGLGMTAATAFTRMGGSWRAAVVSLAVGIVLGGWGHGAMSWNDSFRGATPFPPPFLTGRSDADQKNP